MKNLLKASLALLVGCFMSFNSFAGEPDHSNSCGLGWQVSKSKSILMSSIRETTNSVASNTIAMTVGTSGCTSHALVLKNRKQQYFVEANYENLVAEMAKGEGEYLSTLAHLMGCSAEQGFGKAAQDSFSDLVDENGDALQMLDTLRNKINHDKNFQEGCSTLS